ncbi:MAG: ABC transporter permease [Ilumatobacteraceae bacterium]|jgi:NitT/TauT family transport system permease protein|nr:ABC transporter permease [Ilumatobacteraceae bacterium]MDP4712594.1 ABC transporter permease [Ilumatobacteraceae bacterium]MDP4937308.1 ABC transporter permease [Ilumatobacteraceae bacterium]MDP4976111.1 ABC transporter permease [Ilumatobacteraceae bacterium]
MSNDQLKIRHRLSAILLPLTTLIVFLTIWYLYAKFNYDNPVQRRNALPYPHEIITDGFMPINDKVNGLRPILGYMWPTVKVTLLGLSIAIALGVLIAVLMNLSRGIERSLFPYAVLLQTVPILAITPLLTELFGEELGVRLVVTVLVAIFPVITNMLFGLQSTDRSLHDLFTLNHASRWTRLIKLEFPSALPSLMTGIRIASGSAVIGSVVADFFFAKGEKGIGYYIRTRQQQAIQRPEMFAGTITASLFGILMFILIGWATSRAIRNWHDSNLAHTQSSFKIRASLKGKI